MAKITRQALYRTPKPRMAPQRQPADKGRSTRPPADDAAATAGAHDVQTLAGATSFADRAFIQRLYSLGMKGYFDGLSIHPYNESR